MTAQVGQFIGLGGVAPDDNTSAHAWEKRLDGVMIAVALLSVLVTLVDAQSVRPGSKMPAHGFLSGKDSATGKAKDAADGPFFLFVPVRVSVRVAVRFS